MDEDAELRLINARKMADLKRRIEVAQAPKPEKAPEKSSREIVMSKLYDRGDEVLNAAYSQYPKETETIVDHLAKYLKRTPGTEGISGGELKEVFRMLGVRVSLNTSIKVQEKGKFVDLVDKFRLKKEGDDGEELDA